MNNLTIAGNVGKDAEVRNTQNGKTVCNFTVAVSGRSKDADSTWFDCALWGERGEKLAQYIRKGDKITVAGEVSAREHSGKAYLQIFVKEVTLQGGKPSDGGSAYPDSTGTTGGSAYGAGTGGAPNMDDEIPFYPEVRL